MFRKFLAAFIVVFALPHSAHAGTYTGIWWNQNESGWGISITQQFDTLFAAMYVYNQSGQPVWYTAALRPVGTSASSYSGDLFATTGPYFGSVFNPAAVNARRVGTMTFNAPSFNAGTLTYSVDSVQVTKSISQLTFTAVPGGGDYSIITLRDPSNTCSIPAIDNAAPTLLTLDTNDFRLLNASTGAAICTARGTYGQAGSMYAFSATAPSCFSNGRLVVSDLRIEGVAGASNSNIFVTGIVVFRDNAASCASAYYIAGVRIR